MKNHKVTLTAEERKSLQDMVKAGKRARKKLLHARILPKRDVSHNVLTCFDARIAEALEVSTRTIERLRERFVEQGLEAALGRKPRGRPSREPVLDGKAEARLIAIACSTPPPGRARWTLRLLADRLVELEI